MNRRPNPLLVAALGVCVAVGCVSASVLGAAPIGASARATAPDGAAIAAASSVPLVAPTVAAAPTTVAPLVTPVDISSVIDVGDAKQPRSYDAYLAASLADIQAWWSTEYPRLFGSPYVPLAGGIFAAYPARTTPIPSCGGPNATTTYQEVADYAAFYCPLGDFMAYDDGDQGVLYDLAETYGPAIIAVVMAHEFGHAIQFRNDQFGGHVETIRTEQQADCFSGAWSRRAWSGEATGMAFTDSDVRTGLIALVTVRDPVGVSLFDNGGHGSAFDRIGAFQHGFIGGIDACSDLIDSPLPLLPNMFNPYNTADELTQGNAPFGYGDQQLMGVVQTDLIAFWPSELSSTGVSIPLIQLRPVADATIDNCGDAVDLLESGAVYCSTSSEVLFVESRARQLYDQFGDFAVGYVIGHAWADGIQADLGYTLSGEERSTVSDCLAGAWVSGAIRPPDDFVGPTTTSPFHPNREMVVSPGDLDEAVQTALLVGDPGFDDDVKGSAFEKIAYLRLGVLEGTGRCLQEANRLAAS